MPRTASTTKTGTGASPPIALNPNGKEWTAGLYVTVTGAATYTIEVTPDSVQESGTPRWFALPDTAGLTAAAALALPIPALAVRLNVSAGAGTVNLTVVPAGLF